VKVPNEPSRLTQATENDDEPAPKHRIMGCVDVNVIFRGGPAVLLTVRSVRDGKGSVETSRRVSLMTCPKVAMGLLAR